MPYLMIKVLTIHGLMTTLVLNNSALIFIFIGCTCQKVVSDAATCITIRDNDLMTYASSADLDQPLHLCSLIRSTIFANRLACANIVWSESFPLYFHLVDLVWQVLRPLLVGTAVDRYCIGYMSDTHVSLYLRGRFMLNTQKPLYYSRILDITQIKDDPTVL